MRAVLPRSAALPGHCCFYAPLPTRCGRSQGTNALNSRPLRHRGGRWRRSTPSASGQSAEGEPVGRSVRSRRWAASVRGCTAIGRPGSEGRGRCGATAGRDSLASFLIRCQQRMPGVAGAAPARPRPHSQGQQEQAMRLGWVTRNSRRAGQQVPAQLGRPCSAQLHAAPAHTLVGPSRCCCMLSSV
jgi:hypothetical protein